MTLNFGYRKYPNGYRDFSWEGVFRLPAAAYYPGSDPCGFAVDSAEQVCFADGGQGAFSLAYFAVLREPGGVSSQRDKCGASVHQIDFLCCDLGDSRIREKLERYVAERFPNLAIILFGDFNGAYISAV